MCYDQPSTAGSNAAQKAIDFTDKSLEGGDATAGVHCGAGRSGLAARGAGAATSNAVDRVPEPSG
jgi:hypothetical protein